MTTAPNSAPCRGSSPILLASAAYWLGLSLSDYLEKLMLLSRT
ncbi:hypothetical protein I551_5601 [Mycobacterium ulcerans str. Harvey]|uniref:Uncharacterized protein n=1 Tax=Mycobacterium ulcerans str. Harvey TaxID=1299332 RepID=A0ABP3A9D7_MYCUL|nr:hypothetical protein I551_5609 [Mycobacterium ulcerans str. Harvey]EUA87952.1 hypothetical protein I551_5601 [Mycobacterium ulcerans str. Harvey]